MTSRSSELAQRYLTRLKAERRYSPNTDRAYRQDLQSLFEFVGERELAQIDTTLLCSALARLHGSGQSPLSIARRLSAWRGFFNWLLDEGVLSNNPAVGLRAPKSKSRLPAALSVEQTQQLLDKHSDSSEVLISRDLAMFELLYSSGLRLAEMIGLDLEQSSEILRGTLRITGKGQKTRLVPVGRKAITALENWLKQRSEFALPHERALFVGMRGARVDPAVARKALADHAIRSGMAGHVHPHMLRHSFASHILQSSGDLRAVQELLGHANIRTTQVYTHLDFQHLSRVYEAAHPRASRCTSATEPEPDTGKAIDDNS